MANWIPSCNLSVRCISFNPVFVFLDSIWSVRYTALTQQLTPATRAITHYVLNRTRSTSPFTTVINAVGQFQTIVWRSLTQEACLAMPRALCVWYVMIIPTLNSPAVSCVQSLVNLTLGLRAIDTLDDQFSLNIYILRCLPDEVMSVDDLLAHSDFYHNSLPTSSQLWPFFPVMIFLTYSYSYLFES